MVLNRCFIDMFTANHDTEQGCCIALVHNMQCMLDLWGKCRLYYRAVGT